MSTTIVIVLDDAAQQALADRTAATLLAKTNGPATVAQQLQHLDADVSDIAEPKTVEVGP